MNPGEQIDLPFIVAEGKKPHRMENRCDGGKPELLEAVAQAPATDAELAEYAGAYFGEQIDPVDRIVIQNGSVRLTRLSRNPDAPRCAPMRSVQPSAMFSSETLARSLSPRDPGGKISALLFDLDRIENVRFTKKTN
jgi:hypothetical protein